MIKSEIDPIYRTDLHHSLMADGTKHAQFKDWMRDNVPVWRVIVGHSVANTIVYCTYMTHDTEAGPLPEGADQKHWQLEVPDSALNHEDIQAKWGKHDSI